MRTAIFLLLGILVIVLIGSFVPQQNTSDPTQGRGVPHLVAEPQPSCSRTCSCRSPRCSSRRCSTCCSACCTSRSAGASSGARRALVMRTLRGYKRTPQYWGEWGSWLFHSSFFLLLIAVVWGKATGYQGLVTLTAGPELHQHAGRLRHAAAGAALPRQLRAVHVAAQQLRGDLRGQRRGERLRQQRHRLRSRQEGRRPRTSSSTIS